MAAKITCIKKQGGNHEDPHHAIERVGWVQPDGQNGLSTRVEMYDWIKDKKGEAYVSDGVKSVPVGTYVSTNGTKCIRTYADGQWTNNLLSLPECN